MTQRKLTAGHLKHTSHVSLLTVLRLALFDDAVRPNQLDNVSITFLCLEEICTLVIAEVFPEDSGMFTCTASNKYGTVSSTAALRVKGNTSFSFTLQKHQ